MIEKPLPDWLKEVEQRIPADVQPKAGRKTDFIEKTITGVSALVKDTLFSEKYARGNGFLQSRDARTKTLALFAFLLSASMAHRIGTLFIIYAFLLALALLSRVPFLFFFRRVWFFMPFYTGIIALPAIFSFITPGRPLVEIGALVITEQGVNSALTLVIRVGVCVSAGVLLVITTKWQEILRALQVMHVPFMFILTAEMTYRYIFLLLKIVSDMHLARRSRLLRQLSGPENREWVTSRIAVLLKKSQSMSEQVYLAMLSRGYTGSVRAVKFAPIGFIDYSLLATSVVVAAVVAVLK
jgi:cobalt/nickel transport system permease protein